MLTSLFSLGLFACTPDPEDTGPADTGAGIDVLAFFIYDPFTADDAPIEGVTVAFDTIDGERLEVISGADGFAAVELDLGRFASAIAPHAIEGSVEAPAETILPDQGYLFIYASAGSAYSGFSPSTAPGADGASYDFSFEYVDVRDTATSYRSRSWDPTARSAPSRWRTESPARAPRNSACWRHPGEAPLKATDPSTGTSPSPGPPRPTV